MQSRKNWKSQLLDGPIPQLDNFSHCCIHPCRWWTHRSWSGLLVGTVYLLLSLSLPMKIWCDKGPSLWRTWLNAPQTTSKISRVLLNFHPNAHNSDHGSITLRFNSHSVSMCMVKPGGHFESQGPTWPASAFVARLSRPPRSAVRAPRSSQLSVSKDVKGCEGLRKLRPR